MVSIDLQYSSEPIASGSYRLLELPAELLQLIESTSAAGNELELAIKGGRDEDAVLCTSNKTYAIRSVVLSNSVLVVTPRVHDRKDDAMDIDGGGKLQEADAIVIQESLNEILELVPAVPRLHRLRGLLRGMEWEEGHEDEDYDEGDDGRLRKRPRFSYEQAREELQASQHELAAAIREKRILIIDGNLRPMSPSYLHTVLELLLTCLISTQQKHEFAIIVELTRALEEHEIQARVTEQVMGWFGEMNLEEGRWKMDVESVVGEVGLGTLRHYKDDPIEENAFLSKWRNAVGDTFASHVSLSLLSGNYLSNPSPLAATSGSAPPNLLTYFPRSLLPTDPPALFADLFLTRSKWKAGDIISFLQDVAVDGKERDRLLLKYARGMSEKDGMWYTARAR